MGRLIDQLEETCDTLTSRTSSESSHLFLLTSLLDVLPGDDPRRSGSHDLATPAHVRILLERMVYGRRIRESFLVPGLIRAVEDVLEDCAAGEPEPDGQSGWSAATSRLLQIGALVEADGGLALLGESEIPASERARRAEADLELWHELTAWILDASNMDQAIQEEVEDES